MTRVARNALLIGAAGLAVCVFLYVVVWTLLDDPDNQLSRERSTRKSPFFSTART